ncbi:MAG: GNAT family N-acetyltransferase [Thermostichales cyanobacterium SRBZ-1_bins_19]
MTAEPIDNRHIRFSLDRQEVQIPALVQLFNRNAFWAQNRDPEQVAKALAFSHPVVSVWDGERMIGFGRATSDGVYRAVLWDIVIDRDYRQRGLGRKLVETLIAHPHVQGVERVYLFTTHQQGFYQRIGFVENPSTTLVLMGKALEFLTPVSVGGEQAQT